MSTEEVELEGLEYIIKFKERLDIVMAYISDGRDITDDDFNVLREIHRIEREGRLPFYKKICTDGMTSVTEIGLFSAEVSVT